MDRLTAQDLFMQQRSAAELSKDPELSLDEINAEIEKARKEYKEGKGVSLKTHEDIDRYFESL